MKTNMIFSAGPNHRTSYLRSHVVDVGHGMLRWKRNVVALRGTVRVVADAETYFGGEQSKKYVGPVLTDPTWGQLFSCAVAAQRKTRDFHHQFFEGFYTTTKTVDGVAVINLALGS